MRLDDAEYLLLDALIGRPEWCCEHRGQVRPEMFSPPLMTRAVRSALAVMDCRGRVKPIAFVTHAMNIERIREQDLQQMLSESRSMAVFDDKAVDQALETLREPWRQLSILDDVRAAVKKKPSDAMLGALRETVGKWESTCRSS
jgi:hypothetical protein